MARRALVSQHSISTLSRADVAQFAEEWLLHCEGQHAAVTTEVRRVFLCY